MISFNSLGNLGRLGNQMFQYAALRGIAANRGFDFCIPPVESFGISDLNVKNSKINIHNIFNISWVKKGLTDNPIIEENNFYFNEELFNNCEDNIDLYGYFQSEKYFKHIESDIKKDFSFNKYLIEYCSNIKNKLCGNDEIISLHVRRGDYLNLQSFHPIQSLDYYLEALSILPKIKVIIFSDDPSWCQSQEIFSKERFFISKAYREDIDLCLMTLCNYHILANSSFSWWGSWLSNSKKTIAPKNWFGTSLNHLNTKDLLLESWIKI